MGDIMAKKELEKMTGYEALEKAIVGLITPPYNSNLQAKPFYAHFIQNCEREFDDKIPTLGVYITDKIHLVINTEFFLSKTNVERIALLEHEILHLVMNHLIRFKPKHHQVWNMACDIAINQYIDHLPKDGLTYQQFKLKPGMETEYYYKELMKNAKFVQMCGDGDGTCSSCGGTGKDKTGGTCPDCKGTGKSGGIGTIDDHKIWDKSNANKDLSKEVVKGTIKQSIKNIKDYGNLPGDIQAELNKILKEDLVNWKRELNRFINRATIVRMAMTRKRPNRRYDAYEGNKNIYKLKLLIGLDTSGSIADDTLAQFFGQIERIKTLGFDIQVAECDAAVGKVYKYTKPPKKVSGRGGTCFKPVFEYAEKYKPDIVIYLTDGYADKNWKNRTPTLWVICPGGDTRGFKFGKVVEMKRKGRDMDN
jgi:predicted metal-dependent peptidase